MVAGALNVLAYFFSKDSGDSENDQKEFLASGVKP